MPSGAAGLVISTGCRGARAQGAGADVPFLCRGFDWSRRPQERSVDGGARWRGRLDQLHHFVAAEVWDSAPLEAALLKEADDLVGDEAGFLVIDDTALPKKQCANCRHCSRSRSRYYSSIQER